MAVEGAGDIRSPSSAGSFSLAEGRLERIWKVAKNRVDFEINGSDSG